MPLPPYVRRGVRQPGGEDRERYQTVFARARPGGRPRPRPGLHFTPDGPGGLACVGVAVRRVTLHVGPATFLPVASSVLETHRCTRSASGPDGDGGGRHPRRGEGRRVVAVGTTMVAHAGESCRARTDAVRPGRAGRDWFIVPGPPLPRGGALAHELPPAALDPPPPGVGFAGRERVLRAYAEAVAPATASTPTATPCSSRSAMPSDHAGSASDDTACPEVENHPPCSSSSSSPRTAARGAAA